MGWCITNLLIGMRMSGERAEMLQKDTVVPFIRLNFDMSAATSSAYM